MKASMEIETSTAAGGALIKIFGVPLVAGAIATALGFMFMWPRSAREAFIRIACTVVTSALIGPVLVVFVHYWWPGLFSAAKSVAVLCGTDPAIGFLFIAAPMMVMGGLPAWWIIGGIVRWFDKRKEKDIGEMARDAAGVVKEVRGAL